VNGGRTLTDALRAFHQGDLDALGEVHTHLLGLARSVARGLGLGLEDAQDAAGQVLVTLLERRASVHVASYVATRIRGELLDVRKKRSALRQPPAEEPWDPERSRHLPEPESPPELDAPSPTFEIETVIEDLRVLARDEASHMRRNDGAQLLTTLEGLIDVRLRKTLSQEQLATRLRLEVNALQARESRVRRRLLERCAKEVAVSATPEAAERMERVDRLVRALAGHQ
jgi:DNA-directed RNA polymerase specialized sigma24 family protein